MKVSRQKEPERTPRLSWTCLIGMDFTSPFDLAERGEVEILTTL